MKGLLIFFILSLVISLSAQASYNDNLDELKKIVTIEIKSNMPFAKKAEGVRNFHDLIFSGNNASYFGKDSLVQKVIISDSAFNDNQYSTLFGRTLYYKFDASLDEVLLASLENMASEISRTDELSKELVIMIPKLKFKRRDGNYGEYSPNKYFLEHLKTFKNILETNQNILEKINQMDSVTLMDLNAVYPLSCGELVTYTEYRHPEIKKKHLVLRWETFSNLGEYISHGDRDFMMAALNILLMKEFKQVKYLDVHYDQIADAVLTLNSLLDDDMTFKLREGGVKKFDLSSHWEFRDEWLKADGTLVLGFSREEMLTVINTLFY